jgi:hypothetical protein
MIIYNVTTKTDWSIHAEWLQWMQEEHIPGILGTGLFQDCRIMRLLEVDETEGPTYAIQYQASGREDYDHYIRKVFPGRHLKNGGINSSLSVPF